MSDTSEVVHDQSVVELVKQIGAQSAALARSELELAEAEVAQKAKRAGFGAGALGAAGVAGLFSLASFTAAAIMALALLLPGWLSALIVGGVYGAIAGGMALVGAIGVKRASPPTPDEAVQSVRQDIRSIKSRAEAARE